MYSNNVCSIGWIKIKGMLNSKVSMFKLNNVKLHYYYRTASSLVHLSLIHIILKEWITTE